MKSYCERVSDFWNWFAENEEKLSQYIENVRENDSEKIVSFLGSGLNLAISDCHFETGGNFEVSLASDGSLAMMFLTNYLCRNMPEAFNDKWHFNPWKPAMPGAEVGIGGIRLGAEDILLDVSISEESRRLNLLFYNETLTNLDEEQAYHVFYLVLEATLGENICMGYIGFVEMAEAPNEAMMPLSELDGFLKKILEESGDPLEEDYNPCLNYSGYGIEPSENTNPRFDIIAGFTCLPDLLDEYYAAEDRSIFELFKNSGAKAVFMTMNRKNPEDHTEDLELRNTIADRLETEILGEPGNGNEIGVILGQAIGLSHCYIDLLLYDEKAFLEKAGQVLQDYGEAFFLYDYHQDAEPKMLI